MSAKSICSSTAVLLALAAAPQARAQDPAVVAPDIYKCTFENEHTRVCEVTFKPGMKIAAHSHPDHLIYVLAPGKLRITDDKTGKSEDVAFTKGQSVWMPAVTHHGQNIGGGEIKALVIEFKGHQGMAMDKDATPEQ